MPETSKEKAREMFLDQVRFLCHYWADQNGGKLEACEGLAFSIMNIFDGSSGGFPAAIDLVLRPHPDDKDFNIGEGEDWIVDGQVINDDCHLHEMVLRKENRNNKGDA